VREAARISAVSGVLRVCGRDQRSLPIRAGRIRWLLGYSSRIDSAPRQRKDSTRMTMHLPALDTALAVLLFLATGLAVARARSRYGIKAPATTGNEGFELVFRMQMNTLEALAMFLPSLWLAATYWNAAYAGYVGIVWLLARAHYAWTYASGRRRGPGFTTGLVANLVLVAAALYGIVRAMLGA
jgi:glutathione S-transferase